MNWSHSRPPASGYYWIKEPGYQVRIGHVEAGEGLFRVYLTGSEEACVASEFEAGTLWAGPLQPPGDAARG